MHGEEIQEAVREVVDGGWYLQGASNRKFEEQYADFCHANYCVGCANGLDALTLSLRSLMEMGEMSEDDEVIVPANTYIATILAITENHLKAVLVEPRLDTLRHKPSAARPLPYIIYTLLFSSFFHLLFVPTISDTVRDRTGLP